MTKFKLAFVNFYKEKRGRRVVSVSDIEEFLPEHHADFVEGQTYQVNCPHFPTEGSFSTQGLYDAKILCIGVSMEDLEHEAKMNGLKIPKYTDADEMKDDKQSKDPPKKSSKGRSLKTASKGNVPEQSEPGPRMKKKRKSTVEDECRDKRHSKTLDKYSDLVATLPEVGPSKHDQGMKNPMKVQSSSKSITSCQRKTESLLESNHGQSSPDSRPLAGASEDKEESCLMMDTKQLVANQLQKSTSPLKPMSPPGVSVLHMKMKGSPLKPKRSPLKMGNSPLKLKMSPLKLGRSPLKVARSSLMLPSSPSNSDILSGLLDFESDKGKSAASDESAVSISGGDVHPDSESVSENGLIKTQTSLNGTPPSKCVLRKKRVSNKKSAISDSESLTSTEYVSSDEEMNLYRRKTITLENDLKRLRSENRILKEKLSTYNDQVASLSDKLERYSTVNMKLQDRLLAQYAVSKRDVDSELGLESPNKEIVANKAQKKLVFDGLKTPPVPEVKLEQEKEKHGSRKRKLEDPREDSVTGNKDLARMIMNALNSKTPLEYDGNGKVHIGNGVWFSKKLWEDKLRKSNCSATIAIRDAMEKIYTREEMAKRSLEGGLPVRASSSGDKKIKKKMTPSKREALLALYRAKTAINSGSDDSNFLDLAVAGKGKDTIRYKLKESAKAYEKGEKEMEEKCKKEMEQKSKKEGRQDKQQNSDSD